jgi:hypothetical protein
VFVSETSHRSIIKAWISGSHFSTLCKKYNNMVENLARQNRCHMVSFREINFKEAISNAWKCHDYHSPWWPREKSATLLSTESVAQHYSLWHYWLSYFTWLITYMYRALNSYTVNMPTYQCSSPSLKEWSIKIIVKELTFIFFTGPSKQFIIWWKRKNLYPSSVQFHHYLVQRECHSNKMKENQHRYCLIRC